jgi:hypothetical protein
VIDPVRKPSGKGLEFTGVRPVIGVGDPDRLVRWPVGTQTCQFSPGSVIASRDELDCAAVAL